MINFKFFNTARSSSQATLDSLDLTRYSEDGERSTDDRVAVLEFELRKAKDTINALRANLTEAAGNKILLAFNLNSIHLLIMNLTIIMFFLYNSFRI